MQRNQKVFESLPRNSKWKMQIKKLILIYELALLACVDGHYSSEENDALRRICAILYVEFEKLREILDLVKEYCEFRRHAEYVLERTVVLYQENGV